MSGITAGLQHELARQHVFRIFHLGEQHHIAMAAQHRGKAGLFLATRNAGHLGNTSEQSRKVTAQGGIDSTIGHLLAGDEGRIGKTTLINRIRLRHVDFMQISMGGGNRVHMGAGDSFDKYDDHVVLPVSGRMDRRAARKTVQSAQNFPDGLSVRV